MHPGFKILSIQHDTDEKTNKWKQIKKTEFNVRSIEERVLE